MAALKKGDLVLITGGTGWVGSHVVDKALEHGLSLRLAIRNQAKADKLIKAMKEVHGQDIKIETIFVKDMSEDDAYLEAVKDVDGIVHIAANLDPIELAGDIDDCLKKALKSYESILNAAHNVSSRVRRLVICSSGITLGMPNYENGNPPSLGPKSWYDDAVNEAHKAPHPLKTYAACKVTTEFYVWEFLREYAPKFVVNSILPSMCIGRLVPGTDYSSTGEWVRDVLLPPCNNLDVLQFLPAVTTVDVDDVALLHVLALINDDVRNERLLAFGDAYSWFDVLEVAKQILPAGAMQPTLPDSAGMKDNRVIDVSRAQELLAPFGGMKSLEYSLRRNLEG